MSSEVVLRTVPSHHLGRLSRPTAEPYRRVVGMDIGVKTLWASQKGWPRKVYDYDPSEAKPEVVDLPRQLALGVTVFFQHWLASPNRTLPYNCHSFADFVQGSGQTSGEDFSSRLHFWAAKQITSAWTETPYPLPMGKRGVIANAQSAKPYHSLIGLGQDNPDCLQVTQMYGFMALDTYDSVLGHYAAGREDKGGVQLYTQHEITSPAVEMVMAGVS